MAGDRQTPDPTGSAVPAPARTRLPAPRQVLADHVYDQLIGGLVDGQLEPDAVLNIDALARQFEVSQTPIREALARLEATGLVTRMALKGYRVSPLLSAKELGDLLEARLAIEPVCAYLACRNVDPALTARLRSAVDQLAELIKRSARAADLWHADERFHSVLAEAADNQFLFRAYTSLGGLVQRFRLFGGHGVTDVDHAEAEHRTILAAFERRDPDGARQAMQVHLTAVKDRALRDRSTLDA